MKVTLTDKLKWRALKWSLPLPLQCRHIEYSTISSQDDDVMPSPRLLDIALAGVQAARGIDLSDVSARMLTGPFYPDVWPGEHYKLLAGLVRSLQPKRVMEIGTFQGLGTLSLLKELPPESKLTTVDIIPWQEIPETILRQEDFASGRVDQILGDLADPAVFDRHLSLLGECDLIFVDGPKDVVFEKAFLAQLGKVRFAADTLLVFDDIRKWNMLEIWRQIKQPKLDLTSFGHWSGTGLVDLKKSAAPTG